MPEAQLVSRKRHQKPEGVTDGQLAPMLRESASLDRDFCLIEESYAADHSISFSCAAASLGGSSSVAGKMANPFCAPQASNHTLAECFEGLSERDVGVCRRSRPSSRR